MVTGSFVPARFGVNFTGCESVLKTVAEQNVINSHALVARPTPFTVIPPGEFLSFWMQTSVGIKETQVHEALKVITLLACAMNAVL